MRRLRQSQAGNQAGGQGPGGGGSPSGAPGAGAPGAAGGAGTGASIPATGVDPVATAPVPSPPALPPASSLPVPSGPAIAPARNATGAAAPAAPGETAPATPAATAPSTPGRDPRRLRRDPADREPRRDAAATRAAVNPAATTRANAGAGKISGITFGWPLKGTVLQDFGQTSNRGLALGSRPGAAVSAAADGKVIFSGAGPREYGNLVIVKHEGDLLSVYANNSSLAVKEGQEVRRGQKIAEAGTATNRPQLHFEIRQQGKPIDPLGILPSP